MSLFKIVARLIAAARNGGRPRMLTATSLAAGLLALTAPALAETNGDYFATRLLEDSEARGYLELGAAADYTALAEIKLTQGDLDRDGIKDYVLTVHARRSTAIAAFLAKENQGIDAATYAGFIPADGDSIASVRTTDVTGDGADDIRVEASATDGDGGVRRILKIASLAACDIGNGRRAVRLKTIFLSELDGVERGSTNHRRSTHLVRFADQDNDGINEIIVTSRCAELVGNRRDEREVAESVQVTRATYKFANGAYAIAETDARAPAASQRLAVAAKLAEAGEHTRAALIAHSVLEQENDRAVVERARNLLESSLRAGGDPNGARDVRQG